MMQLRNYLSTGVVAAFIGCGGAMQWQDSCGCIAVGSSLLSELKWDELPDNPALAPIPVALQVKTLLKKADNSKSTLQKLRSLGPFSESVCFERAREAYR